MLPSEPAARTISSPLASLSLAFSLSLSLCLCVILSRNVGLLPRFVLDIYKRIRDSLCNFALSLIRRNELRNEGCNFLAALREFASLWIMRM